MTLREHVMLLHDLGDSNAGARWRADAPRDWIIPDLPGHGDSAPPRTGHYDPMAPIALARWSLPSQGVSTLIGVREHAHSALVHAAGGGCGRVVVVDGLGSAWLTPQAQIDSFYANLRAMYNDRSATEPPPLNGLDPRARYSYGVMTSSAFARRFWSAIDQPILAIETPASPTPPGERAERVSWFNGKSTVIELDNDDPATIINKIQSWQAAI